MANDQNSEALLSFCILYLKRLDCFRQCIAALQSHTRVPYRIHVLAQGPPDAAGELYLAELAAQPNVEITYSDANLGCGGGRAALVAKADTPYIMILDDDAYVTEGWFEPILAIFDANPDIGAVGPVQVVPNAPLHLGHRIHIDQRRKVVRRIKIDPAATDLNQEFLEVDDIGGAAMVFRSELKDILAFDGRYTVGFDDIDKSLQILLAKRRWRQVIALKSKVHHVRSTNTKDASYESIRWDYLQLRESYRKFQKKWGLRYAPFQHLKIEYILPNPILRQAGRWTKRMLIPIVQLLQFR